MPANIAHMVIAHKAFELLRNAEGYPELSEFAAMIDGPESWRHDYYKYMNVGSIGPDLYAYASMVKSSVDMLLEGFVDAEGVTPWSYQLHSFRPNEVPLNLIQVMFKDVVRKDDKVEFDDDDKRKLAYVAGHLCHIAADQIIHPLVNEIAQPYYRKGSNRTKHRKCEVFQDYFLYEEVYRDKRAKVGVSKKATYDFFRQDFHDWVDCITGLTMRNTADWFRYFLQRGLVETYGVCPTEQEIEDSMDNLLTVLKVCKIRGPYKDAAHEYEKYGAQSPMYQEFIARPNYMRFYEDAVRLSAIYITALFEVYTVLRDSGNFDDAEPKRFLAIVSDADLSCPLQHGILNKARKELTKPRIKNALKYKQVFP
jgi:hypothetical protein